MYFLFSSGIGMVMKCTTVLTPRKPYRKIVFTNEVINISNPYERDVRVELAYLLPFSVHVKFIKMITHGEKKR